MWEGHKIWKNLPLCLKLFSKVRNHSSVFGPESKIDSYIHSEMEISKLTHCGAHEPTFLTCSLVRATVTKEGSLQRRKRKSILFLKLFWPSASKNCSSDRERLLKFKAEAGEFAIFLRSLGQSILTILNNFWNRMLFKLFLEVSQI